VHVNSKDVYNQAGVKQFVFSVQQQTALQLQMTPHL